MKIKVSIWEAFGSKGAVALLVFLLLGCGALFWHSNRHTGEARNPKADETRLFTIITTGGLSCQVVWLDAYQRVEKVHMTDTSPDRCYQWMEDYYEVHKR